MEQHPTEAEKALQQAYHLYDNQQDFTESLRLCEVALTLEPDWPDAHNFHGILLEELDKPLRAMSAYRKALKVDPSYVEAQQNLDALKAELSGENPLVTAAVTDTLGEAHDLKGLLEEAGIKVIIPNEHPVLKNTFLTQDQDEIHLLIRKDDSEAAIKILDKHQDLFDEEPDEEDDEALLEDEEAKFYEEDESSTQCPWCGSHNIKQTLTLPFLPGKWKCQDCGQAWRDD